MSDLIDLPSNRAIPETRMRTREQHIVKYATSQTKPGSARRRVSRLAAVLAGASVLVLGATAAAAYVAFKPATVPVADETRCYTKASLEGGDDFFGTTVSQAWGANGTRNATSAVETCHGLWDRGFLQLNQRRLPDPGNLTPEAPVPPLVACSLNDGVAAVFPGDAQTCFRLGLPQLTE